MKNFLKRFFMTLGVIFFLLIIGGAYLYIADPFGIKLFIKTLPGQSVSVPAKSGTDKSATGGTSNATGTAVPLNSAQEEALRALGIDPAAISAITPEVEKCFYAKLGSARADEIKAGAAPTPFDYLKAGSCLQ
ncbi:MAG: hypothetical protein AAB906_00970, partial [Patescibacteria group bacterium]